MTASKSKKDRHNVNTSHTKGKIRPLKMIGSSVPVREVTNIERGLGFY